MKENEQIFRDVPVLLCDETVDAHKDRFDIDGVMFPETVPVHLQSRSDVVGIAKMRKEGKTVVAEIRVNQSTFEALVPSICGSTIDATLKDGVSIIEKCKITSLMLGPDNADSRIKPLGEA